MFHAFICRIFFLYGPGFIHALLSCPYLNYIEAVRLAILATVWLLVVIVCDDSLKYGDLTIFKMVIVRHLEFSKFGSFNGCGNTRGNTPTVLRMSSVHCRNTTHDVTFSFLFCTYILYSGGYIARTGLLQVLTFVNGFVVFDYKQACNLHKQNNSVTEPFTVCLPATVSASENVFSSSLK